MWSCKKVSMMHDTDVVSLPIHISHTYIYQTHWYTFNSHEIDDLTISTCLFYWSDLDWLWIGELRESSTCQWQLSLMMMIMMTKWGRIGYIIREHVNNECTRSSHKQCSNWQHQEKFPTGWLEGHYCQYMLWMLWWYISVFNESNSNNLSVRHTTSNLVLFSTH